ncbi:MAG: hypothetical protein ACR2Q3_19165 [Woeseiaceae bacterium]
MPALLDSWLLLALLAAGFWAISCVIDVCLVGEGIIKSALEGTIIMGLFSAIPLVFLVSGSFLASESVDWSVTNTAPIGTAALAGICYFLHAYFNFRALFAVNDASNAEIFNNLTVLFVPMFAFVLLGERLHPIYYLALGLALCGILTLLRGQIRKMGSNVIIYLLASVVCMSLAMVLQAWALRYLDYSHAVFFFSSATLAAAIFLLALDRERRDRIIGLCKRIGVFFAGVELLDIAAVLLSQRSTSIAPSVTLVAVAECALPVFIMALSGLYLTGSRFWKVASTRMHESIAIQTEGWGTKVVSISLIACAIVVVHLGGSQ